MPEFLELLPPGEALKIYLERIQNRLPAEEVETWQANGRVAYQDIFAPHSLPTFDRSTVDGYAVRAVDTHGASDSMPAYLRLAGEIRMGEQAQISLEPAECCLIHTGGMLPAGSDAVVMLENTQIARPGEIETFRPAAPGENVIKEGEDIQAGEIVVPGGKPLTAADIGGLLALGLIRLPVVRLPEVAIISSGDEIVSPVEEVKLGQVRDINSYTLSALIEHAGARPRRYGILPDQAEPLRSAAQQALQECDLVVITAGSSASKRDLTSQVIDSLGEPGVLIHGVNVRPGKPTILAACQGRGADFPKPVIGLPGNPVSALVIAILFVVPVINHLLGMRSGKVQPFIQARLGLNLSSSTGREDWVPVKITTQDNQYHAQPIFGKSNLIFTLARADGLLHIPADATGMNAGDLVEVLLF